MKKLYIIQIAFSHDKKQTYLPYAAGCLSAAVRGDRRVNEIFGEPVILFERCTVGKNLEQIVDPDVVSFTNYIWNFEYNKQLAKAVKEKYPDCLIIFGGHNISADSDILLTEKYIDVLMYGEGEISFPKLLHAYCGGESFDGIAGASFRKNGEIISVPAASAEDLSGFISPYLTGVFDKILENNPDTEFHATIETNRGCPYSCAYCEWCFDKRIRQFPMEKIKAEIEWLSEKKIEYCFCADGNFGILKRDVKIAKWVVEVRKRNGYPHVFKPTYAINNNETVFEAGRILYEAGADKGITISYQSMSEDVLENIGRENLDINRFNRLSKMYNEIGIPTYSDLILGLPGETFESFCEGICRFMEFGQHNSVSYYRCQVYSNSTLGQKDYMDRFDIKTTRVPIDNFHYTSDNGGVEEYFDVITSTGTMTREDWEKMNLFGICTEAFHHIGLLRCFALYLRNSMNVPYYDFYKKLFGYLLEHPETFAGRFMKQAYDIIRHPELQWSFQKDVYGDVCWFFDEGCFLECLYNGEEFRRGITGFLRSFGIPDDIFEQLMIYQEKIIRIPGRNEFEFTLDYDFYGYFNGIYTGNFRELEKKRNTIYIKTEKQIDSWEEYAREIVWYGKRRGATMLTNSREHLTQKFL